MFTKILLFLTFLSLCMTQSLGQTCGQNDIIRVDTIYAKLLTLGGSGRKFPEDKQAQLKKYCSQSAEYIKEADEYRNRCLKQTPKQVSGVILYSMRNMYNQLCKKDTKKVTNFIESNPCANGAKQQIDKCYTTLIDKFLGSNNAPDKMKIPHTCCNYFKFIDCVEKGLTNKNCNEKRSQFFTNWVREIFGNAVDLVCGDYTENSDKCDKIAQTPPKKKSQKRTKSFMLPLIDTLSSLPDA